MDNSPSSERGGFAGLVQRLRTRRNERPKRLRQALALAALLVIVITVCLWPWTRAHFEAVAVLDIVGGQPVPRWLSAAAAEPVSTRDVTIPTANGPIRARLYAPTLHPDAPAMMVLHGVHHLGMDEPRLVAFATALAGCGLRVLTPELPGIKDYHVAADSIRSIGDAAAWLATQNQGSQRHPVGVMGLSFSGGLALLAAADPVYKPAFKFVVAVGSQASMSHVAEYYRTGAAARPQGEPELLAPHEYGALVLEYENLEDFVQPADVEPMRAMLRAHLYEDAAAEKNAFAAMTSAQHEEAMQLLNTTSPATRAQLAASETKRAEAMAGVSPHGHLATMATPVYLLHGAGDNIIPASETEWMAAELPPTSLRAELVSPVLSHLNLDGARPTGTDRLRLVHFFGLVLHAAKA